MNVDERSRAALTRAIAANLAAAAVTLFASVATTPDRPVAVFVASDAVVIFLAAAAAEPVPPPPPPPPEAAPTDGAGRVVSSTAYCLDGRTASGESVHAGGVAMNGVALGSRFLVSDGPLAGSVLRVNDRIGHGSDFDVWFDDCGAANAYGRRTITIVAQP